MRDAGAWNPRRSGSLSGFVFLGLLLASTAQAIPSLNPHSHTNVGFEDPAAGGAGVNHHHWDPLFPLYPGNGVANDETAGSPIASAGKPFVNVSFDAYSAWDAAGNQAIYRDGDSVQNFGHGFISSVVPYRFEGGANGVPANAIADINASVVQWETQVTNFFNGDANFGAPSGRLLGFNFGAGAAEDANFDGVLQVGEDANGNGLMDGFTITWQELGIAGAVAQWLPGAQQLQFDGTVNWFFGGAGNIPAGMTDFFTIAMHELGHVIGLNHINSGVAGRTMRSDIILQATAAGTTGVRTADIGSVFGATALYVIPEPGTLFLVGLGTLVLGLRRRRRRSC